jgi:two-component system sensor histidine kinase KdpD
MDASPRIPPDAAHRSFDRGATFVGWRPLSRWLREGTSLWREYVLVVLAIGLLTAIGVPLPEDYYQGLGFIYLLVVILLSLRIHRGAAFFAGILSVAVWDYVFLPPRWDFAIVKLSDALLLGPYFVVAIVLSQVTVWIRDQAREEHAREQRATTLFNLTKLLAAARSLDEAATSSLRQLERQFGAQTALALFRDDGGPLALHPTSGFAFDARELAAVESALSLRRPAGRSTGSRTDSVGCYFPLVREDRVLGVLGILPHDQVVLTTRQRELLEVFAGQLALIVEREHLRAASEREKLLAASAKLQRTLLESVSHELRTPLAVITSALENLHDADPALRDNLFEEARTATRRLNRLVGNLLDQTRLEGGAIKPRLNWCDARDIVNAALDNAREALAGHPFAITVPLDCPLVRADFALMEHALSNLLFNAAQHTPAHTPIAVTAGIEPGDARVYFEVADRGPGIPAASRERMFQKFIRGEAARAGGLGLGLSLVRGFITAQGGDVVVDDNPGGGARITLYLPHAFPKNALSE